MSFVVVWLTVSLGLSVALAMPLSGQGATFAQHLEGLPLILFFVAPVVLLLGVGVGLPIIIVMRHFRLAGDFRILAGVGTVAGLGVGLGFLMLSPDRHPGGDYAAVFLSLGAAAGFTSALIWWAITDPSEDFL